MKTMLMTLLVCVCYNINSADRSDEPKPQVSLSKIDYSKLFRRSGQSDDPTHIYYYLEDKNENALQALIEQAKKDNRVDILKKALVYAAKERRLNALQLLLDEEVSIDETLIVDAILFMVDYAQMDNKAKQVRQRDSSIYQEIIVSILDSVKRESEFKILTKEVLKGGNYSVLLWLLHVAARFENLLYVTRLTDIMTERFNLQGLNLAVQELTAIAQNPASIKYKDLIQFAIDRLNNQITNLQ